jgi:hypothetical protein
MYLKISPDHEDPLVFDRSLQASMVPGGGPDDDPARGVVRSVRRDRIVAAGLAVPAVRKGFPQADGAAGDDATVAVHASIGGLAARLQARAAGGLPGSAEVMPDLAGLSLRLANEALASRGLVCRNDKKGPRVTRQDPDPGTSVARGTSCLVIY